MAQPIYDEREQQLIKILKQWINREELEFIYNAIQPL